jgi:hypothetical protein
MSFDHLRGGAKEAVLLTPEERINFILEDRWVGYDAAKQCLSEIGKLANHPRNIRMPCRAIIGDPENGKSTILSRCADLHPPVETDSGEYHVPVLYFQTPPEPDEGRLYSHILNALRIAHRPEAAPEKLLVKVYERFAELGIRVLLADEFHHMLLGRAPDQRQLLGSIKNLLNTLKLSLVVAGTQDVMSALASDAQFVTRFEKITLPRWGINQTSRNFIASLEVTLPLALPSGLADNPELFRSIVTGGEHTIGGITKVCKNAAIMAIHKGTEQINQAIVDGVVNDLRLRKVVA